MRDSLDPFLMKERFGSLLSLDRMARYFYTITRDGSTTPDPEGVDLKDDDDAWEQAVVTCAEIIRDEDGHFDWECNGASMSKVKIGARCSLYA